MHLKNKILRSVAAIAICASIASCTRTNNRLPYFEDISKVDSGTFESNYYDVTIQPDDELFITVNSMIPSASVIYNLPMANPGKLEDLQKSIPNQYQTYIVSRSGNIDFPVLGRIHVEGLTTEQLAEQLRAEISKDVEDPLVRVELVNFKVNVLGEVKTPGPQVTTKQRYSIIDAISAAGDLTEYGERSNVILVRETNGKREFHHLNLNDSKVLESPYYYLRQNDWIYVSPNEIRQANSKYSQYNSYKLSTISTIVSATSVIASLVIALTIK